jgi:hypothetical protein
MGHEHASKVLEWAYKLVDGDMIPYSALYGCVSCDATSTEPFPDENNIFIDHTTCGPDCFGCKARGLQMNTGDANSQRNAPRKRFESELSAYANAKAQGIQPGGTSMEKIREAERASEVLNKPYNANSMPDAKHVNQSTAAVMKEIGQA